MDIKSRWFSIAALMSLKLPLNQFTSTVIATLFGGVICTFSEANSLNLFSTSDTYQAHHAVETLSKEDVDRYNLQSLSQALALLPGTEVARSEAHPSTKRFNRGTEAHHTVFLINGQKLPSNVYDTTLFQMLNLSLVDRIRLSSGSSSPNHSHPAIGGALEIFTAGEIEDDKTWVDFTGGANNTRNFSVRRQEKIKNTRYVSGLQVGSRDFNGNPSASANGTLKHGTLDIFASKTLQPGAVIHASQVVSQQEATDDSAQQGFLNQSSLTVSQFGFKHAIGSRYNHSLHLGISKVKEKRNAQPHIGLSSRRDATRQSFSWHGNVAIDKKIGTSFGYEYEQETTSNASAIENRVYKRSSPFIQLRLDTMPIDVNLETRRIKYRHVKGKQISSLSFGWNLNNTFRLYSRLSEGYNTPVDVHSFTHSNKPLQRFRPEYSTHSELGVKADQSFFDWSISAFKYRMDDRRQINITAGSTPTFEALSDINTQGIEGKIKGQVYAFVFSASIHYTNTQQHEHDETLSHRRLKKGILHLGQDFERLKYGVIIKYLEENKRNNRDLKNYTAADLYFNLYPHRSVEFSLKVDNVGQANTPFSNQYTEGRNVYAALKYHF